MCFLPNIQPCSVWKEVVISKVPNRVLVAKKLTVEQFVTPQYLFLNFSRNGTSYTSGIQQKLEDGMAELASWDILKHMSTAVSQTRYSCTALLCIAPGGFGAVRVISRKAIFLSLHEEIRISQESMKLAMP